MSIVRSSNTSLGFSSWSFTWLPLVSEGYSGIRQSRVILLVPSFSILCLPVVVLVERGSCLRISVNRMCLVTSQKVVSLNLFGTRWLTRSKTKTVLPRLDWSTKTIGWRIDTTIGFGFQEKERRRYSISPKEVLEDERRSGRVGNRDKKRESGTVDWTRVRTRVDPSQDLKGRERRIKEFSSLTYVLSKVLSSS